MMVIPMATRSKTWVCGRTHAGVAGSNDVIGYDMFINCSWFVTRWQYTFTHKQYTEQHK